MAGGTSAWSGQETALFSMAAYFQFLALAVFTAVMAVAAFEDFRRLVIPNLLPILLCAVWPLYVAATGITLYGAGLALGCALLVFLVGAVLFARGLLGGGDVKLLAAAVLWAGPTGTTKLLLLTCVFGGALALFLLLPFGRQAAAAGRWLLGQPPMTTAERGLAISVPYGIAIAGAAVAVMVPLSFG
jgi:prepilin peptidase CpaA